MSDLQVRMPNVPAEAVGREQIRDGVERLQGLHDCFGQGRPFHPFVPESRL
jgi:hypothetical protein